MLNQVHVEGFVTRKVWQHSGDTFFRLAVYRDPDRTRKEANHRSADERDQPDYVTTRVPAMLTTLPVEFQAGQRVQVYGWLESREFDYTLAEFLAEAQGPRPNVDPGLAGQVAAHRSTIWLVAERIITLDKERGERKRKNNKK